MERGDKTWSEEKRTSIVERHFPENIVALGFLLCYLHLAKKAHLYPDRMSPKCMEKERVSKRLTQERQNQPEETVW